MIFESTIREVFSTSFGFRKRCRSRFQRFLCKCLCRLGGSEHKQIRRNFLNSSDRIVRGVAGSSPVWANQSFFSAISAHANRKKKSERVCFLFVCLACCLLSGRVAQSVEQWSNKPPVAGSIPVMTNTCLLLLLALFFFWFFVPGCAILLEEINKRIGAAAARWAHNPKVQGSKP